MAIIDLPALTAAGTVTVTAGLTSVTGDATTLSVALAGQLMMVDGAGEIQRISDDPVSSGGGCTLELLEPWGGATLTATAYVTLDAIDDATYEVLVQADHIGTFAGRAAYNAQSSGFDYLSVDGAGGGTEPIMYERVTATAGTWQAIANVTYYVAPAASGGSDTANDGLTTATPFLTLQKADDTLALQNITDKTAAIYAAAGTYTAGLVLKEIPGFQYAGQVSIIGESSTTCIISTVGTTITDTHINTIYEISGFKIASSAAHGINARNARLWVKSLNFGTCKLSQMLAQAGGKILATGNLAMSGGAQAFATATGAGAEIDYSTRTITGSQAYSIAVNVFKNGGSIIADGSVKSGSCTGPRGSGNNLGSLSLGGAAQTILHGNSAVKLKTGAMLE